MIDMAARSSPFVNAESFEGNGAHLDEAPTVRSPFIHQYVLESEDEGDPAAEARRLLLNELEDDEFESAIYELAGSAAQATRHVDGAAAGMATLELRFAPLAREMDAMLVRAGDRLGGRDVTTLAEGELDEALAERSSAMLEPSMEQFLGGLKRIVGKAVSGAANLAKKGLAVAASLGLKPILDRIRKALPKLLRRIITAIINRLPASLQADAKKLAAALPIQSEYGQEEGERAFDVEHMHHEFNESLAEALLDESESDPESEGEWRVSRESSYGINDLDAARERFVGQLSALGEGEDPTPAVEGFIPALIPVLKVAEKLAGRKRIVSLLASMVASLIGKFVGPASAKALSTAMVDSGLKLVGLEVAAPASAAHEAIAATVEETVRRVAALPDETLDARPLAEAAILREFEAAAAANFPPLLPARVYWQRPDLRETDQRRGVWIASPMARRRKRFKKYSHVVRARITPRMAMSIKTFGETPLADYLTEQLGVAPGDTLEAEVHLYEAMPGMLLGEIGEAEGVGGTEDEYHPLTAEAASLLLGEPGLGQEGLVPLAARAMPVGQRFFRLAVPQQRVAMIPGTAQRRRKTSLRLWIDTASGAVVIKLFLSERRAQEIARGLRAKPHAGMIAQGLRPVIDRLLGIVLSGRRTGRLRLNHTGLSQADARGPALKRIPPTILDAFRQQVAVTALGGLADFFGPQSARFMSATEDTKDGVTLGITINGLPQVAALRGSLSGQAAATTTSPATPAAAKPTVTVDVTPGFAHA